MLQPLLVAVLAGALIQISSAKESSPAYLREQIGDLDGLYARYVEVKSDEIVEAGTSDDVFIPPIYPKPSDEQRKQSVKIRGFLVTIFEDLKRIFLVPLFWAWDVVWLPINFSKTAKNWWDIRGEKKKEQEQQNTG